MVVAKNSSFRVECGLEDSKRIIIIIDTKCEYTI